MLLKIAAGNQHLDTALRPLLPDLGALPTNDLECMMTYILTVGETSVAALRTVIDQLGPHAKEVIVTTAERLRAEGEAQGKTQGRAEGLLELLALKFGPLPTGIADTVHAADMAQLQLWNTRVLTASSLDEVLQQ